MTLRHARVLLAVLEAGDLQGAAERLNVTQPAVSKALTEMEEGLGAPLFAGNRRHQRPTALCVRLAAAARALEANVRRAAEEIGAVARGAAGELLIGASNVALIRLVPQAIALMQREFPRLNLNVISHPVPRMFDELRAGRIDVLVARAPFHVPPGDLCTTGLGDIPEVVVASVSHPLSSARRLTWEAACGSAWLWPLKGTRKRDLQDRFWRRQGLPRPDSVIEVGDTALSLSLLQGNPMFAVLPLHSAQMAERFGIARIVSLKVDLPLGDLSMWHVLEPQGEVVQRFKAIVLGVVSA